MTDSDMLLIGLLAMSGLGFYVWVNFKFPNIPS